MHKFKLACFLTCLLGWPLAGSAAATADCVILLHGLGRSELSMKAVEWRLKKEGYRVVNQGYPSLEHPIEKLAVIALSEGLDNCQESPYEQVHFVTHSLGGILLRQFLSANDIENLGRTVMLGPPNQGSQLADYIQTIGIAGKVQPMASRQLGTDDNSVPRKLSAVDFEVGVIAGNRNLRPFTSHSIEGPSDGTVTVEETKVAGMSDFLELPATHTLMMWQKAVLNQIVHFLAHGKFSHSPDQSAEK